MPRLSAVDECVTDGLLDVESARQSRSEPALDRATGWAVLQREEHGLVAMQTEGSIEPAEEGDGDDQGVVAPAEVIGRAAVDRLVGVVTPPSPLVNGEAG